MSNGSIPSIPNVHCLNKSESRFFLSHTEQCKVERLWQDIEKADYGDFVHSFMPIMLLAGLEEIWWRLTSCKRYTSRCCDRLHPFPAFEATFKNPSINKDRTASDSPFITDLLADPMLPAKQILSGLGSDSIRAIRKVTGAQEAKITRLWLQTDVVDWLSSDIHYNYIKLQRLLQIHFTFAPWLSIRPSKTAALGQATIPNIPFSNHWFPIWSLHCTPASHIFVQGIFHL